jgi:hypothetical protein
MKAPAPSSSPQESQDAETSPGGPGGSEAAAEPPPRTSARRACQRPASTGRRQRTGKNARGPPLSQILSTLGASHARAAAECAALQEHQKARVGCLPGYLACGVQG